MKILGKGSKEKILQKLISDYPDAGYHLFKDARLKRFIPDNHPLKQKEFSEAASRLRSQENRKKKAYDGDKEWLHNLSEEDKLRKENEIRNWMLIAAVLGFGLLVVISF